MSNALTIKRPHGLPKTCSDAALLEAVKAWLLGEPPRVVAEFLNVPIKTLPHWINSKEWNVIVSAAYLELQGYAHSKLGRLVNLSLAELADRLENGDEHVTKDGVVVHIKIKGRDLATIATMLMDKQTEVKKRLDGIPDKEDTFHELFELAAKLRYANAKEIQGESVEQPASPVPSVAQTHSIIDISDAEGEAESD